MPSQEDIDQQQQLLATYRSTLAHLLRQAAQHGGEVFAPPQTVNGIVEARANIWCIKQVLRDWNVAVDDLPDDVDTVHIRRSYQGLLSWAAHQHTQKTVLDEKELNSVRAFQTAMISTSNYIGRLESGEQPDRAQEEKLAQLWSDAAIAFYGVDGKIALLLHLKALSWSRPAEWIDDKLVEEGITFTDMNEQLMRLLKK